MQRNLITFFVVFMAGGALLSGAAWFSPPVEVPTVAEGEVLSEEAAQRIRDLELERDLRESVRRGNVRGINWGVVLAQMLLLLMAADLVYRLVTNRPGPIQRAVDLHRGQRPNAETSTE